ncbi:hypothetical protein E4L95_14030 [Paracoccus liaowanqingii]|uniref:Uncharacterized protein n=1 Tax=Paracoccus liaowanqingii TaxID=2560053 RepID=A0A4Z1CL22_9RHOB|nr:hypothetical protein [Paracoccus liaowanqingii]TGN56562.1 hypothetical protein E4L95_14030 [Paracoccus liaowanqingii]
MHDGSCHLALSAEDIFKILTALAPHREDPRFEDICAKLFNALLAGPDDGHADDGMGGQPEIHSRPQRRDLHLVQAMSC